MPRYEYPAGRHPGCRPIRHPGAWPEPHERRVQARISPRCNGPGGRAESIRPLRTPGLIPAHVSSARESRSPIVRRPTRPSVSTRLAGSPAPHIFRSGTCTSTPVSGIPALRLGRAASQVAEFQPALSARIRPYWRCSAVRAGYGIMSPTARAQQGPSTAAVTGRRQARLLSPSSRRCATRCIRCGSRAETRSHRCRASRSERCA